MTRLLAKRFRLMFGKQFFLKSRQALAIRWRETILVTEIEIIAQPFVIVRPLTGHDVLLRQPRFVASDQFQGNGEHSGISGVARVAKNNTKNH